MIDLTKWPGLIVVGNPVTKDQAAEICIRTNNWDLYTNNEEYDKKIQETFFGKVIDKYSNIQEYYQLVHKFENKLKVIKGLDYLSNHRVASSWIGGPHGWCDWNGNIFCNTFNIGKWPTIEEITSEWKTIAEAFPFLELKAQLLNNEICEEDTFPVIQFNIKKGKVRKYIKNLKLITSTSEPDFLLLLKMGTEIGISITELEKKVNNLLLSYKENESK